MIEFSMKNSNSSPVDVTITGKELIEGKLIKLIKENFPNFEQTDKLRIRYFPYATNNQTVPDSIDPK